MNALREFKNSINTKKLSKESIIAAAEKLKTETEIQSFHYPLTIVEEEINQYQEFSFVNCIAILLAIAAIICSLFAIDLDNTQIILISVLLGVSILLMIYLVLKFAFKYKRIDHLLYVKSIYQVELEKESIK